jgi:ElaB/YqjD/DUF883 family membrane-anchored ribosome-binding protein
MKNTTQQSHETTGSGSRESFPKKFDEGSEGKSTSSSSATASQTSQNKGYQEASGSSGTSAEKSSSLSDMASSVSDIASNYSEKLRNGFQTVKERASTAGTDVNQWVQKRPLLAIGIALGSGVVIGRMLASRSSMRE